MRLFKSGQSPTSRPVALRTIQVLSLIAVIGFIAFCVGLIWVEREDAKREAVGASLNVAQAIAETISRNFQLYDLSLEGVIAGLQDPRLTTIDPAIKKMIIFNRFADASYVDDLIVLDPGGRVVEDANGVFAPGTNLSSRDYFEAQRASANLGLYISKPEFSEFEGGDWIIGLSRRITSPGGAFEGVVVATISLAYFETLFENIKSGPQDSFAVMRSDGTMIMRSPFRRTAIGQKFTSTPDLGQLAQLRALSFEGVASVDRVDRIYSLVAVENLPLVVGAGLSKEQLLAPWRDKMRIILAMMLILSTAMGALGFLLTRELRLRRRAELELADLASALAVAAATDELTGLPNRRSFDSQSAKEWSRAIAKCEPISMFVIDVDYFKQFNDCFGHQYGDRALRLVASCIRGHMRGAQDYSARYGGEEFAALLPGMESDQARSLAEEIRASVAQTRLSLSGDDIARLTISVGVSTHAPKEGELFATAFAAADQALYEAKKLGRNRVGVAVLPDAASRDRSKATDATSSPISSAA
jgi:diguanylate cyclase (GGDEF)-like protein